MRPTYRRGGMTAAILVVALLFTAAPVVAGAPGAITTVTESYLGGPQVGNVSSTPRISADGRYVLFSSRAANILEGDLVPKWWDSYAEDLFLRDMQTGQTRLVNCTPTGGFAKKGIMGGDASFDMTPDGRYVVFVSTSTSLTVGLPLTGRTHIFRRDMFSNETTLVSCTATGQPGDSYSFQPTISDDGNKVAFMTESTNFFPDTNDDQDVVVKNLTTGKVSNVSFQHDGRATNSGSSFPCISGDGKKVGFLSRSTGIVAEDEVPGCNFFVRDLANGGAEAIDVRWDGSVSPSMSTDCYCDLDYTGRNVMFVSNDNLVPEATGSKLKTYLRDMSANKTQLISRGWGGAEADGHSDYFGITDDARYAVFTSLASNIVPGDTNGVADVFLKDLRVGTVARVSLDQLGGQLPGWSYATEVTPDGRSLVFAAQDAISDGIDTYPQHYLKDLPTLMASTSCSLTCESTTLTAPGATYAVSGIVTAAPAGISHPVGGLRVSLQAAPSADATFTDTGITATTTADGSFTVSAIPTSMTYYRVQVAEADGYAESASTAVSALPMSDVGTPIAPRTMYRTKYSKVYGSIRPAHLAGSSPVRIYKYRYVSGKWRSYGYVNARAQDFAGYTRYSAKMRLTYKGKWRLRAFAPADAEHAAAWSSRYDYVTVK